MAVRLVGVQSTNPELPSVVLATMQVRDIRTFGTVGDGVANDTVAVQAAFTWAVANNRGLSSRAGDVFLVDPITITGGCHLEGAWRLVARTLNQTHLLSITGRQEWATADIELDCQSKALYGIKAANFGRSRFGRLRCDEARIWGFQFDPSGNNNFVQVGYYASTSCGQGLASVATQSGALSGASTSLNSYATFNLTTPIAAEFLTSHAIYFVRDQATGLGYLVKTVVDADTLQVYNFDVGDTNTATIDIYVGGGVNLTKYGDNGVGVWGGMDIFTCPGVGLQISSLYGHVINNAIFQTGGIGIASNDYTLGAQFNSPYFENNDIDWFSSLYVDGVVVAPKLAMAAVGKFQNRYSRLNGLGEWDQGLQIINPFRTGDFSRTPSLRSSVYLGANPSGKTLKPGFVYSMSRTTGGFTLTVDNTLSYMQTQLNSQYIILNISYTNPQTGGDLTVQLSDTATETVEGGASAVVPMAGKVVAHIYKVGVDWKVNVINTGIGTAITAAPKYTGQVAVVSGVPYTAVAVTGVVDWQRSGSRLAINAQTGTTYTLALTDAAKLVTMSNTGAIALTIPTNATIAFAVGTEIHLAQINTGQVTVSGAGVTIHGTPGLNLRAQYSRARLIKYATDTWLLSGDLSA